MKGKLEYIIPIEQGVTCHLVGKTLTCKKGDAENTREINLPYTKIQVHNNNIVIVKDKGNKKDNARLKTYVAHIKNMMKGLSHKFTYELEICFVHFPMTVKVEGKEVVIDNFLGEKKKRRAKILPNVKVEVNGNKIIVTSPDVESAGQTATNLEKATLVKYKDRRIFQDGIFLTAKKGVAI